MINKETFEEIESYAGRPINPGNVCYCIKTSRSKKPKPIKGNFYICRKIVDTKWGRKLVVVDLDSKESWSDVDNLIFVEHRINQFTNALVYEIYGAPFKVRLVMSDENDEIQDSFIHIYRK